MGETSKPRVLRAAEIRGTEATFSHPWNPNSSLTGTMLARATGLTRVGVNIARIPPGKESFTYHVHYREEEWIYVLSGRGVVEIDGTETQIAAGDFVGFPASVAHHLRNPFDAELVYLMGGENLDFEVADFPRLGKRMVRRGSQVDVYELADGAPMPSPSSSTEGAG